MGTAAVSPFFDVTYSHTQCRQRSICTSTSNYLTLLKLFLSIVCWCHGLQTTTVYDVIVIEASAQNIDKTSQAFHKGRYDTQMAD